MDRRTPAIAVAIALAALIAALLACTWNAWADPVVDFGREAYVPWLLLQGAHLYRDVAYFNGPLSPYVNAAVFSLLGPSIRSLLIANAVVLACIAALLFYLLRRIAGRACAAAGLFIFFLLFAFGNYEDVANYNYLAPYSHEMTHGLLLSLMGLASLARWLATGRNRYALATGGVLGLLLLTKPEIFAAMALASAVALLLARAGERSAVSEADCPICVGRQLGALPGLVGERERTGATVGLPNRVLRTAGQASSGTQVTFAPITRKVKWGQASAPVLVLAAGTAAVLAAATAALAMVLSPQEVCQAVLGAWPYVFNPRVSGMHFYRLVSGWDAPVGHLLIMFFWLAVQLVTLRFACRAGAVRLWTDILLLAIAAAALAVMPSVAAPMNFFLPLPLWVLLVLTLGFRKWSAAADPDERARVATGLVLGVFALAMLAKVLLNVHVCHYGFVLAMPAVMTCLVGCWWLGDQCKGGAALSPGRFSFARFAIGLLLLLAMGAGPHLAQMAWQLSQKRQQIAWDGDCPIRATREQAAVLQAALETVKRQLRPQETLAVWPQGCLLSFAVRRAAATPYIVLMPPEIEMFGEQTMLDSHRRHPPDFILLLDCDVSEYGVKPFGVGYARRMMCWLRENYAAVEKWGKDGRFAAVLMKRND
ncbi:MAG: hypothetical protein ABSG68_08115 [Thermoguttaceae bacterium]|jgi:hypothetical protein